MYLWLKNASF